MAIETVYLHQNTSIIPDEMWAHRVGLVPIKADPQDYQFKQGIHAIFYTRFVIHSIRQTEYILYDT